MKDYNFEPDNHDFDETIILDDINKELKKIEEEQQAADELGDKNAFLNAFESERFEENAPRQKQARYEGEEEQPPRRKRPEGNGAPRRKSKEGIWNKRTMGILCGVGVLIAILCFALFRGLPNPWQGVATTNGDSAVDTVLVKSILDSGEMVIYDIEKETTKSISLGEEVEILDEKSAVTDASQIHVGELLQITLDDTKKIAEKIEFGGDIVRKEMTGLTADTAQRMLVGEDVSFAYEKQTMFQYNGESLDAKKLEPCDTLRLKAYGDIVWSVEVLEYHGYIVVENKDNITEGKFKLDEEDEIPLEEVDRIPIAEGTHTVTVSGENIETRTDSIFVETGEEYLYDLSQAQEKVGVVIIDANVTDYKLYINGTLVDSTTPAVLPMGEYDLVILKNEYKQWSQRITLEQDTLTVTAHLDKEVQYGTLSISADVEDATVWINGKRTGVAPMEINLTYGLYEIEVTKSGYSDYSDTVTINTGSVVLRATLD